jgi:hypothetical protein
MSQILPNLNLPLMQASQAQKHVTHNEALNILDTVAQLSVLSSSVSVPPSGVVGDRYLVAVGGTGVWTGQDCNVALFDGNVWLVFAPKTGWLAFDQSTAGYLHFNGLAWVELPQGSDLENLQTVGINTTADATNRLSISAPATLYSHEGAGHQIKVNKASATDTASLLFQSDWTGHAEMGLNGSNNWSLKISPDGSAWQDALSFDPTTGAVSGVSVQSSATDTTTGRLMRADYGYGPGNVVGMVAEVGGVPSGAVIERGSTVNGEFTRFADGLQICTSALITVDVDVSVGALFKSAVQTWTYPNAFVAAPVVSGGNVSDVANLWVTAGQSGISDCSAVAFGHASATGGSFCLTAVGRWF